MSRGFLMYAHNNEEVDYGLIALCNALMIKTNMRENAVALVTDNGTKSWLIEQFGEEFISRAFDHIIMAGKSAGKEKRAYQDTASTSKKLSWYNGSRSSAYDVSPFDETILIDADYLICDNTLDHVWGTDTDLMMNRTATSLNFAPLDERETHLNSFGIPMYWATCVYFRKSEFAKMFFDVVAHVKTNIQYYQFLYRFPGRLFRNDYVFSIAAHTLGGWTHGGVENLPVPYLLTSFDRDELHDVVGKNKFVFLVNDAEQSWKFNLARVDNLNVHIMNKFSIVRNAKKIISLYGDVVA